MFATGGIGGVHRDAPFDESADLDELARTPMVVVCAGAKSILDLAGDAGATRDARRPGRRLPNGRAAGILHGGTRAFRLDARADDAARDRAMFIAPHRALGRSQAMLVVQPPPADVALDRETVEAAVERALERGAARTASAARR